MTGQNSTHLDNPADEEVAREVEEDEEVSQRCLVLRFKEVREYHLKSSE